MQKFTTIGDALAAPFGMGACLTPLETRPPHMCYCAKFGHFESDATAHLMEIRRKIRLVASRLSMSLTVIATDAGQSVTYEYDYLLVMYNNNGSISNRFRDKRRFPSKFANFPHPVHFTFTTGRRSREVGGPDPYVGGVKVWFDPLKCRILSLKTVVG